MEQFDYIDDDAVGVEDVISEEIQLVIPLQYRGERLDKSLAQLLPAYSRSRIQQWLEKGIIQASGKVMTAKTQVLGGETISFVVPEEPQNQAFTPENIELDVIYEDNSIAILNKPAGMVVHPAAGNWSGTLLNAILHRFPNCASVPRAGIVHRLDKDTSGLLVIAKTIESQIHLVRQLQDRTVNRKYLALIWGDFPPAKVIRAAIGRDPKDRLKMSVQNSPQAKEAITYLQKIGGTDFAGSAISLLACKLETGRTHQIRVHLESLGYPLVNDPVYKKKTPQKSFDQIKQLWESRERQPGQLLHASVLGLIHPQTQEICTWSVNPPQPYIDLLTLVGIHEGMWSRIYKE